MINEALPPFVRHIQSEMKTCQVTKIGGNPLPAADTPVLISVMRNEFRTLHDFLRHYRRLGIRRFAIIDNDSTDQSLDFLKVQPDVDIFTCRDEFSELRKLAWINKVIDHYGQNRWYLSVDADELLVFHQSETRSLDELIERVSARGIDRVLGFMIDMYAEGPLLRYGYKPHDSLVEAFPLFDAGGYSETATNAAILIKGGPRMRAFSRAHKDFDPLLTKYPLFKIQTGEIVCSPHFLWPYDKNFASPRLIGLLHYKFTEGFAAKVKDAIDRKVFFKNSFEYSCYQGVLAETPELELVYSGTRRYKSAQDLVDSGLLKSNDWPGPKGEADMARETARRTEADRVSNQALATFRGRSI